MKIAVLVSPTFQTAIARLKKQALPFRSGHALYEIAKRTTEEHNKFEAARIGALESIADKDEAGNAIKDESNNYRLSAEALKGLAEQMTAVLNGEVELPKIKKEDLSRVEISAEDLDALEAVME